jgi:pyruvate/2-oxoglutarate dehydrogenase complex dihydrolipoamide dehydrogenase (E3) component
MAQSSNLSHLATAERRRRSVATTPHSRRFYGTLSPENQDCDMAEVLTPDICVIGAGSAGLAVAAGAAAFGVPVVLIERDEMGGSGLNAVVPARALAAVAQSADFDFAKAQEHVRRTVAAVALENSVRRFAGLGVRVIKGHASFKDRRTVTVGDVEVRARRFVIATGSSSAVPPIADLEQSPYFTGETIFSVTMLPKHLIVIGAGSHALALAQTFHRLGSRVTVLDAGQPLVDFDPEAAAIVTMALERDGVAIRTDATIAKIDCTVGNVTVTLDGSDTINGTHLLVAAGRKANTEGLKLEAAGIRFDADGIIVNTKLKTRNGRVYAIGDVAAGQPRSVQAAQYHAGLVIRHALFRQSITAGGGTVPRVTYTNPEAAEVGISEAEARKRRLNIRILRWSYHDNDRARMERKAQGHIKVITTVKGMIVGVTIVGAQAGELISMWALAIAQGLNIAAMADVAVPYPALTEVGKRAAITYFMPSLTSARVRRIIGWLRIFG